MYHEKGKMFPIWIFLLYMVFTKDVGAGAGVKSTYQRIEEFTWF